MGESAPSPSIRSSCGREASRKARWRALPDRRELARLPGFLRPPRVDRDGGRAPDERDLRLRLDDGEAPHRLRPRARDRGLGPRHVRAREGVPGVQGAAEVPAGSAAGAMAASGPARGGLRVHQRRGRGVRGRRRDRHADPRGDGVGDARDDRLRGPRRLPARERSGAGDDDVARGHGHQGLRPRGSRRALRRPARARARPDRAQGRHLGQHPGRPRHRRQDRRPAAPEVRVAGEGARVGRRDLGRQAQGEPDGARRRRADLEAARDDEAGRRRAGGPDRERRIGAGPEPAAGLRRRIRAARRHPAAGGRVQGPSPRPLRRRDDRGRPGGGRSERPGRGPDRDRGRRRPLGGDRRREDRRRGCRRLERARRRPSGQAARRPRCEVDRRQGQTGTVGSRRAGGARDRARHDDRCVPGGSGAADVRPRGAGGRRGHRRAISCGARRRRTARARRGGRAGRPGHDRAPRLGAGRAPARAARRVRPRAGLAGGGAAAARHPRGDGARGAGDRSRAPGGDRRGDGGANCGARGADLRGRGPRVHDRLAAATGGGPVRRARADP